MFDPAVIEAHIRNGCELYHGELPSDVSHSNTAWEEYAGEPGAYIQEVWRRVPERQKSSYLIILHNVEQVW